MTRTASTDITAQPPAAPMRLIDIGAALDLLACAAATSRAGQPRSIVGNALLEANVTVDELDAMRGHRLRNLYREARLPIDLTLGAMIVLDAAERSEDCGSWGADVLDDAMAAAAKFLELVASCLG